MGCNMTHPPHELVPPHPSSLVKRLAKVIVLGLVLATAVFLVLPSPIDPVAATPPPSMPLTGPLEPNQKLRQAELLVKGKVQGPEDVHLDEAGRIYGGTIDGKIIRIATDGTLETFADTGGRPLGMDFDNAGNLIVCDADHGLLSIDPAGKITILSTEAGGVPFRFADDVEIAPDGLIYFSDASSKFDKTGYMLDLFEGRPHGRLICYNPGTLDATVLLDDLYFANGVAIDSSGEFLLVNETYQYRVRRYWLKGPKAGTSDTFIEHLPGFPDGISVTPRDTYWIALFTVRNDLADQLASLPFIRKQLAKLPASLWPKPDPYGFLVEVDKDGKVLRSLQDPGGEHVSIVTSSYERDGKLYFGSLLNDYIGKLTLDGEKPTTSE